MFCRRPLGQFVWLCLVPMAGCGQNDGGGSASSAVTAAFLTMADVTAGAHVNPLTSTAMKKKLDDTDDFYDNSPDDNSDTAKCTTAKVNAMKIKATTTQLTVGETLDMSECLDAASFKDFSSHQATLTLKFFGLYTCDGADLSQFDGKNFGDITGADSAFSKLPCTAETTLFNSTGESAISGKILDSSKKEHTVDYRSIYYNYTGNASAGPCHRVIAADAATSDDGCLSISRSLNLKDTDDDKATETQGFEDYTRLETVSLVAQRSGNPLFYKSGKFKVQINNWNGEMTYVDIKTSPTWSMKSTVGEQTGTFKQ